MNEQRCERCRWWGGQNDDPDWYPDKWHTCASPAIQRGYNVKANAGCVAAVENDVGWGIATAPHFGCVMWEDGGDA